MSLVFPNLVKERTSTVGTGDLVLTGALSGHFTFGAKVANGDTFYYSISDTAGQEGGLGTYVSATNRVQRTTVFFSSLGGTTKVPLTGRAKVWVDVLGEWFAQTQSGGLLPANNLSDLTDKAVARTNLQLGTMAVQNADNVAVTGGAIAGATISIHGNMLPETDDGSQIGSATKRISDIFLAAGAFIDWSNGNMTIGQSAGVLQINGGYLYLANSGFSLYTAGQIVTRGTISDDANAALTLAGGTSGRTTVSGTMTISGHLTIEGVTSAGATGTVNMVFSASPTLTGAPLAPTAAGGTNTTQIATTAFVTSAVATAVTGTLKFVGATDCSGNPNYPAASKGDVYVVSVAGKIGGASGTPVDVGDQFFATADNAGGTQAAVGSSWTVLEHNLQGALLTANALSELSGVASTARSNLGLGTMAVEAATSYLAIASLGANVATALAVAVGNAGAFVTFNGPGGTPSAITLTNANGTASININGTVGATTPAAGTFTALTGTSGSITGLTALAIRDTSAAFDVTLAATSSTTITAGRTLTFDVADAARTIKLTGNPTLANWFDQNVKAAASPTFVTVTAALAGNATTATLASTVTTNANLTGPITSSGNATSVASQTGTGTKFVMDASPTLSGTPLAPTATAGDNTTQIATTAYVTGAISTAILGLESKTPCRVASTANLNGTYLAGVLTNAGTLAALVIDGVSMATNDRVLLKDQTTGANRGLYVVTTVGSGSVAWVLTRSSDADATGELVEGNYTVIEEGTANAGTLWILTTSGTITIGATSQTWTQLNITSVALANITGFGTGVATALAINVGSAGAVVTFNGAGGTPSSLTLTNATGLLVAGGGTGNATATAYAPQFGGTTSTAAHQSGTAGTAGQVLKSGGASAVGAYADDVASFGITIDGGGSAITTGVKGYVNIPYACTITSITLTGDVSGSIVIDVWKLAFSTSALPTVANTITASAKPTLSSAKGATDSTLTGWTISVTAGDTIGFNVDSCTTTTKATLVVKVKKS